MLMPPRLTEMPPVQILPSCVDEFGINIYAHHLPWAHLLCQLDGHLGNNTLLSHDRHMTRVEVS